MSDDRLQNLANAVGAVRPGALNPREVVKIELSADGDLQIELANGDQLTAASAHRASANSLTAEDVIRALVPNIARSGGRFPVGVPFLRRQRGARGIEFSEAGR